MNVSNHEKVMEYLDALDCFSNWLRHANGTVEDKQYLMHQLSDLTKKSLELDEDELAVRLYHLAGGYREAEFFMPAKGRADASEAKEDYNGKLIVMISHELSRTGAPVVFLDAARILKDAGYYVIMLSPMGGPLRKEICACGIPVIIDHCLLYGRCEQAELREVHRYQHWMTDSVVACADLIIANTAVLHNVVERYMRQKTPIIWWLHEGNVSFESFGDCMPVSLFDNVKVVYVSDYVREQLMASGISYPGIVMHYGVDDFANEIRKSAENGVSAEERVPVGNNAWKKNRAFDEDKTLDENKIKFVMVGAVSERKGQDLLIDAINRLPLDYLNQCVFYFVGSPADSALYQRLEMLSNGTGYIKLCKSMPRDELISFYQECDCIICASRDDPLPVVLTEMMILGKACICSEHTGTASYITDGVQGYLFKNEDVDALVQKICLCVDHPEKLEAMGRASRNLYEEQFTTSVFERNLLNLVDAELEKEDKG